MANRFWVGGTGTWDASTTTHWAATTGGAGGASAPTSADTVTFDASSGGGTVTVSLGGSGTFQSITGGAFTGTLDFSVNNDSVTLTATSSSAFSFTGTGVRSLKLGSGTFTAFAWNIATATNLTLDAGTSTVIIAPSSTAATPNVSLGGGTYNTVQYTPTSRSVFISTWGNIVSIANLQINGDVAIAGGVTVTVTSSFSANGSSGAPILIQGGSTTSTIALGSVTPTISWAALQMIKFTSTGSPAASSSFDCGANVGITITQPSGGGGGGLLVNPGMSGGMS